jgi:pyruvate dehydrogenase E2 component (dihydrolipoamide acetyltransferase)
MAEKINMPKLGFDMAEGTLVRWVVQEGEEVQKGGVLAEIETDKATVEVESTHEGVLHKHLVAEGDVVPVGDPIAIVGEPGEEIDEEGPSKEEIAEAGEGQPGAFTPDEVAEGEGAEKTEPAAVGEVEEKEDAPQPKREVEPEEPGDGRLPQGVRASPVARRLAEDKGIDIRNVEGTGPGGRVVKSDVETYIEKEPAPKEAQEKAPAPAAEEKAPGLPMPAYASEGPPPEDRDVPLTRLRSIIGKRMVEVKQQVPHFYVTHEFEMGPLMKLRSQINEMLPKEEKISVNDFIVKATAQCLRQFPNLNAAFKGDKVVQFGQVNIGNAVAVEGGLLTVVVRDADRKPLRLIAVELRTMAERARQGRVRPEDIEGSTFSISNMGMFDVEHFIAIINPPEAAILAVGSAKEVPVVADGEIKTGLRMKATLSVDHRVSDGAEAARFLQALAQYLEDPLRLLV